MGPAFLHGDFECGQVNFPQRSLIHDRIDGHPPLFLVVYGKMLNARGNAVRLDALNIGRRHFPGMIRILAEIFEISAA
ncbi:hypothetical protein D1872_334810 [compost metagenome]